MGHGFELLFRKNGVLVVKQNSEGFSEMQEQLDCNVDSLHRREKEEFLRLLGQTGEVLTPEEEKVLDHFLTTEGHISPEYLTERIGDPGLDKDQVEKMLEKLCRYGIAQKVQLNGRGTWFEHLHLGSEHDHLLCTSCGEVTEFKDPFFRKEGDKVANRYRFQPLHYKMTILGLCPKCRRDKASAIPLSMGSAGEHVRIVRLAGGREVQQRLRSLGINVGDTVEIINNKGPVIVSAKGSRIGLGLGLARKVMVAPVE